MAMDDALEKVARLLEELGRAHEKEGSKMNRTSNVSAAKRLRAALLKASKECKQIRKMLMEDIKETQNKRSEKRNAKGQE